MRRCMSLRSRGDCKGRETVSNIFVMNGKCLVSGRDSNYNIIGGKKGLEKNLDTMLAKAIDTGGRYV